MCSSAPREAGRAAHGRRFHAAAVGAVSILVVAAALVNPGRAVAQVPTCNANIPQLDENVCAGIGNSIDDYETCYRNLYDQSVIPAFRYIAECSHARAVAAIGAGLESAAAQVTGTIEETIAAITEVLNDPIGPAACIAQLNAIHDSLAQVIQDEREADDLDQYRRENYSYELLVAFTDRVLAARQNRAVCDDALTKLREQLVLLGELKARHLDYCQVLRDSAEYEPASRIQSLAQWTVVDPDLDFDQYFNINVTWNSQCGFFVFEEGGTQIDYTPCLEVTSEYQQTLDELNDTFAVGWLAENRVAISMTAAAAASTIAALAGAGSWSGPIGAGVGAIVGLVITGVQYLVLQHELGEFEQMIADKERELREVISENYITEAEFDLKLDTLCRTWKPVVEGRVQAVLSSLDTAAHVQAVDRYFDLSDDLHSWYNELFLWATAPESDGRPFLDSIARGELLRRRAEFDQVTFRARTTQEIAVERNNLINLKAATVRLDCTDIPPREQRQVNSQLRAGVSAFNFACASMMETLAVRTDAPVPFIGSASSDVSCAYKGFRSDVASVEVRPGAGNTASITVRDAAGGALAELTDVSSATAWPASALSGFVCASEAGGSFGTSEQTRLAPGTYSLRLPDNIYGFGESDAAAFRTFMRDVDDGMRFKTAVCKRQLGTPIDLPRVADACGIPTNF